MMEFLDRAADWLAAHLTWLPADGAALVLLPVFGLATYGAVRWVVRSLAPALAQRLLAPVIVGLIGLLGVIGLTAEFLATQLFRLAGRRPPAILYGAGDLAQGAMIVFQSPVRAAGRAAHRLRYVPGIVLLAVVVALLGGWNAGYCDRHTGQSGCRSPVSAWTEAADEWWRRAWQ